VVELAQSAIIPPRQTPATHGKYRAARILNLFCILMLVKSEGRHTIHAMPFQRILNNYHLIDY
jgi:hypothetical protein